MAPARLLLRFLPYCYPDQPAILRGSICRKRTDLHNQEIVILMAEKSGRFEQGVWVEEKQPVALQADGGTIDQRLSDATKSVRSSIDNVVSVTHDLVATPEGKAFIENTIKDTQKHFQVSFEALISRAKAELEKTKIEIEKTKAELDRKVAELNEKVADLNKKAAEPAEIKAKVAIVKAEIAETRAEPVKAKSEPEKKAGPAKPKASPAKAKTPVKTATLKAKPTAKAQAKPQAKAEKAKPKAAPAKGKTPVKTAKPLAKPEKTKSKTAAATSKTKPKKKGKK